MTARPFRFGVVAAGAADAAAWVSLARRAESLGYSILLMPDNVSAGLPAPLPALTAAATATTVLRVGTFVHNCAVRNPRQLAWEAATVDFVTGGRFELGLGTGRPGAESDGELLGMPYGPPGKRIAQLRAAIAAYKELLPDGPAAAGDGPRMFAGAVQRPRPPLLVAAGGDRMLGLAAAEADIVTFGLPPSTDDDGLAERADRLRELAGDRLPRLELGLNIAGVGSDFAPWLRRMVGGDPAELAARGSVTLLPGSPPEMADTLRRRRDRTGISYVTVSAAYMDRFAPVLDLLGDE